MIAIVDYGVGNLRSVQKGFERVGFRPVISRDPEVVAKAGDGEQIDPILDQIDRNNAGTACRIHQQGHDGAVHRCRQSCIGAARFGLASVGQYLKEVAGTGCEVQRVTIGGARQRCALPVPLKLDMQGVALKRSADQDLPIAVADQVIVAPLFNGQCVIGAVAVNGHVMKVRLI